MLMMKGPELLKDHKDKKDKKDRKKTNENKKHKKDDKKNKFVRWPDVMSLADLATKPLVVPSEP